LRQFTEKDFRAAAWTGGTKLPRRDDEPLIRCRDGALKICRLLRPKERIKISKCKNLIIDEAPSHFRDGAYLL
jgi:hypothetical protein